MNEQQELERWREFGHNAFMLLFATAQERPDHKWLNNYGWISSDALFSDLNDLLKTARDNEAEAKETDMHTPGPWEINGEIDCVYIIKDNDGVEIARLPRSGIRGLRTQANARLIAAAPEQNNALIDLVALVKRIVPDARTLHEVQNADDAIRKAKENWQ